VRRPPKAIAEKGLAAQAAAANTPWRRNIRLENAKLHLRSFKSTGENLIFDVLTLQGEIAPFRAGSPGAVEQEAVES
jgi:hypothetical protein